MKNYERYETPKRRVSVFLEKRGHPLLTESPDAQLHHFAEWLDERTEPKKLKPCPFCNGENIEISLVPNFENTAFKVKCNDCGCCFEYFDKEEDAIRTWNTRP